jgi:hypothetical protein
MVPCVVFLSCLAAHYFAIELVEMETVQDHTRRATSWTMEMSLVHPSFRGGCKDLGRLHLAEAIRSLLRRISRIHGL